jgi:hypothetical protein
MRLFRALFTMLLALALVGAGRGASPGAVPSPPSALCRANPLEGVHHPWRLKIISPCAQIVGVLSRDPKLNPSDGDITVNVRPDPGYESLLNDKNVTEGGLHVEVVPRDQPGCTIGQPVTGNEDNLGTCSGANVRIPQKGAHVRVIGAHVLDAWVGWNEIHPAWRIDVLSGNPSPPPPPASASKTTRLAAHLTGRAEVRGKGAPAGKGAVAITVDGENLCWTFTKLKGIGKPTKARIHRGVSRQSGPVVLALGSVYRTKGCVTADERVLEPIEEAPSGFYVNVSTSTYRFGAIRGQLRAVP